MSTVNPFSKREEFSPRSLAGYKFLTILSWLLLVVFSVYYTFAAPRDGQQHGAPHYRHNRTIFGQNGQNYTPFHLSALLTSIYWIALFTLQLGYVQRLFSADAPSVAAAANVGSHFIFHNLLTFGFVMLWCRGRFWWAELLLIVDFFNLNSLYFRHPRTPSFVHVPAVAGPLAWVYVALLWDGAAMVHASSLPARIIANVAIWGILLVGFFFLAAYRDYAVGFCFSFLMAALALGQMTTKLFALQWIFAWVICGVLGGASFIIAMPGVLPQNAQQSIEEAPSVDGNERQPLLGNQ